MKVKINKNNNNDNLEFPALYISTNDTNFIVLIEDKSFNGTVVSKGDSPWGIGHYSNWASNAFKKFEGSITLSN